MSQETYENLKTAIMEGDDARAAQIAREIVKEPATIAGAVDAAIQTIRLVGDRFGQGEVFLPEMMLAAEAMQAFTKIAGPELDKAGGQSRKPGKIVLGTVKGDIHTIGKDIVATMLSASGFEVIDAGVDAAPMALIEKAELAGAQVIGLSALMTTSMPYQKEVIDLLIEMSLRDSFWVIVGGGPVTATYAQDIGANGWAPNAAAAVRLCERLVASGGKPSTTDFMFEER
jgi:methylmalonyl-CoA mutase cobalamin-binding domain/chain